MSTTHGHDIQWPNDTTKRAESIVADLERRGIPAEVQATGGGFDYAQVTRPDGAYVWIEHVGVKGTDDAYAAMVYADDDAIGTVLIDGRPWAEVAEKIREWRG